MGGFWFGERNRNERGRPRQSRDHLFFVEEKSRLLGLAGEGEVFDQQGGRDNGGKALRRIGDEMLLP